MKYEDMEIWKQTSFSQYSKHKKKRDDLNSTQMFQNHKEPVAHVLSAETNVWILDFVYATTEFMKKCIDSSVYFFPVDTCIIQHEYHGNDMLYHKKRIHTQVWLLVS